MQRKRNITPFGLVAACLSTLGASDARWIADLHRTYNKQSDTSVRMKSSHKGTDVLDTPYDFNEQKMYPITPSNVQAGDKIDVTCTWNNDTGSA